MILRWMTVCLVSTLVSLLAYSPTLAGPTLDKVRSAGVVRCGVAEEMAGFASKDGSGRWEGFTVDFCRAVAVAALGDAEKVVFTPLTPASRFPVLLSGKIDLLSHTATLTFGREAGIGVLFAGTYFFDGQTFMVPLKSKVKSFEDLKDATICVEKGTTHLPNLENTFRSRKLTYKPLILSSLPELTKAFFAGQCQAYSADRSQLKTTLLSTAGGAAKYRILAEGISKEPMGPAVRRDDDEWFTLVRWVLYALIEAEERGVTSKNVGTLRQKADDPGLHWFLNSSGKLGKSLGIKPDWAAEIVAQVGNYGEIFERNIGSQGPLKIERGFNRLWMKGGLLYAPPFQ
jgi:general L-amino acid transport system substrate-binding protein